MARTVRIHLLLLAIAGTAISSPGFSRDKPDKLSPKLELQPVIASNLLAPAEPPTTRQVPRLLLTDVERSGLLEPPPYRLERDGDFVTGKRAKLSIAVGDTRLFAVGGKLSRRERPGPDAIEASRSNPLGPRRLESGRLYGGGLERSFGPVDLSGTYQYSRINGAALDPTGADDALRIDDKGKSHSLRIRARIRF
jgi:hypothetical protein